MIHINAWRAFNYHLVIKSGLKQKHMFKDSYYIIVGHSGVNLHAYMKV